MISKSTWLHLRIPFSLYLMPVFCFATAASTSIFTWHTLLVFIVLHFFLYPASNGYNSYFDKDEGSIGGLENPPEVNKELYFVSLGFDAFALLAGLFLGWKFIIMLFIYGLVSKAYSHPYIRLKKNALAAWLAAGIFQGGFTFLMVKLGIDSLYFIDLLNFNTLFAAALATCMIFGFYPMTQIYQHEEDSRRGDITISYRLGIQGTFIFCAFWFLLADIAFYFYFKDSFMQVKIFNINYAVNWFYIFNIFILPLLYYFVKWFLRVRKDICAVNFHSVMKLNKIAAYSLILFFTLLAIYSHC